MMDHYLICDSSYGATVIYDKHNLFDRNDIENGMKLYQSKFKKWETKGVKAVIAISHDGGVFEHQFDK